MRKPKFLNILTKDFLTEQHIHQKKTLNQIAKEVGCNNKTVHYYLGLNGLPHCYDAKKHGRKNQAHGQWKGYEDISLTYWKNVQNGAKNRKIHFQLTIEEAWQLYLKQNKTCALSGRPIYFMACNNNTASIDRIDSSKGYTLDNVQWLHKDLNFAKQSLSNNDFVKMCQEVVGWDRR
jgi:hypothetical protein